MQNINVKLLTLLEVLVLSALPIHASPLYHQPGKYSKINIDPLNASASKDIPMVQSNNFYTVMADDHYPMESMIYQNFESFSEPKMAEDSDFSMEETKFLPKNTQLRAPQPVSNREREIRQLIEVADSRVERKKMFKLKKGSSVPRGADAYPWDQFDYDLYSVNPSNQKKH